MSTTHDEGIEDGSHDHRNPSEEVMSQELYDTCEDFKKTVDWRSSSCGRNCKDKCIDNVIPDGGCVIAEAEASKIICKVFGDVFEE